MTHRTSIYAASFPTACYSIFSVTLEYSSTGASGPFNAIGSTYSAVPSWISYNQTALADVVLPNGGATYNTGWYRSKVIWTMYQTCSFGSTGGTSFTTPVNLTFNRANAGPDKFVTSCCGTCAVVGPSPVPAGATYLWSPGGSTLSNPCLAPSANLYTMYQTINGITCSDQVRVSWNSFSCCRLSGQSAAEAIEIYPNPSTGIINIEGLLAGDQLSVYNNLGEKIYSDILAFTEASSSLNLTAYAPGIYLIRIENRNVSFIKRILKK